MSSYKYFTLLLLVLMPFVSIFSQEYTITESYLINDICSFDIDLDGDIDLVICSSNDGTTPDSLYIFYNDGIGNLSDFSLNRINRIYVRCGNIDNDQYPDIITGHDSVLYIKNNGDGTFGDEISLAPSQGYRVIEYITDMDGDSLNDLVYTYSSIYTKWGILKNEGELIFTDHVIYDGGTGSNLYPNIGTLNDDNLPDASLSFTPAGVHFLINIGGMTFDTSLLCTTKARPYICNLNGIPPDDIAIFSNNTDELFLFENLGDSQFEEKDTLPLLGPVMVTDVADFNNDGFDDYCYALCYWTGCTDSLYISINDQQWDFLHPQQYYVGQMQLFRTESADLNGDNFNDIVLYGYFPMNEFKILWNDGYGGFTYENPVGTIESLKDKNSFDIKLRPNPFTSLIYISIKSNVNSRYMVSIADLFGRRVSYYETSVLKPSEDIVIKWDGMDLSRNEVLNGIYFLTVYDFKKNCQTFKIIKY